MPSDQISFTDIPFAPLPDPTGRTATAGQLREVQELQVGAGDTVFRADEQGIWLGAARFQDAPFSVDMNGNVVASNITLSGYVPTGGAASDVNTGAGTINASKINASTLSAISANLGTITAGSLSAVTISGATITGTTLTTANSGQRVVLTSTIARYYNSGGTAVADTYADSSGFIVSISPSTGVIALSAGSSGSVVFLRGATTVASVMGSGVIPGASSTYDLGASSLRWRDLHVGGDFNYHAITQPIVYWLYVVSGIIDEGNDPGWSVSNPSTGKYTITHNLGHTNYTAVVSARRGSGAGAYSAKIESFASSNVKVTIFDDTGSVQDSDFTLILCEQP